MLLGKLFYQKLFLLLVFIKIPDFLLIKLSLKILKTKYSQYNL